MNSRYFIFSLLDTLKGSGIISDLKDITTIIESASENTQALTELISHAVSTVSAYRTFKNTTPLNCFPVVNKTILRDNFEDHISSKFKTDNLSTTTTSGSTGTPFTIYFDKRKIRRHKAALMFWNHKAGAPLGQRLYYLRVWNRLNRKGKLRQLIENIIPVEISHIGDTEVNELLNNISRYNRSSAILGFSSIITELYRHAYITPSNLKGIIAMSEHLPEAVRLDAQEKFKCPVLARYSNMENGFIAQQYDNSGDYLINTADFVVEILKLDKDEPAAIGEKGRIVVTDLYNYAMPFIRYDTGDIGILGKNKAGQYVLTSIEGRKCDLIYSTSGDTLSSHVITNTLWQYTEIIQFQFIQKKAKKYLLRINMRGKEFKREKQLKYDLIDYLGADAQIDFEYVNEIPVLNSGKRRYIINEYKN